ncbi:MAG: hypothetical protein HFG77_15555 [Hungatella sp.]|jgi:YbbR domain-containing protein|nr:hypothetical protein [Hungatella sp.]
MKEKLTNNLGLKILSIGLAIFAWFMVVNVVNPLVVDTEEVPVEMINEDILSRANLTYELVGKKTVTVTYEVRTRDRYRVSASDFYAYADLANLYDVTGSIPVTVEVTNRDARGLIEGAVTVKPGVVRIQTEELQRKRFDVVPHVTGEAAEGYAIGNVMVRPEYVYVTGPISVVGQINSVGVEVEVPGIESDVSGSSRVILYDANGNELVGLEDKVTLSRGEVDYQVSVLRVKNLSLDFQVSGEVADGYRFTGVDSDVRTISVEGMKSALASLSTIMVPGELLNISGATQDVTVEVDLNELLPDNVSMAAASATSAMITLRVEKLEERGFSLNTRGLQLAGVSEEYEYEFEEDQVTVWIRGLSEDLDRLDSSSLVGLVDVSMLGAGDMDVDVEMELTEGFELMRSDPLQLHITLIGGEEEPGGEGESAEDTQ